MHNSKLGGRDTKAYTKIFPPQSGRNRNSTCDLCGLSHEDVQHFIVLCPALHDIRKLDHVWYPVGGVD